MPDEEPLIIVSNRGPTQFDRGPGGERIVRRGGGGLVTALEPLLRKQRGAWIGWSGIVDGPEEPYDPDAWVDGQTAWERARGY